METRKRAHKEYLQIIYPDWVTTIDENHCTYVNDCKVVRSEVEGIRMFDLL